MLGACPAVISPVLFSFQPMTLESGGVSSLHFRCPPEEEALFPTHWQQWFPKLKDFCSLDPDHSVLEVDMNKVDTSTHAAISIFCHRNLEPLSVTNPSLCWLFPIRTRKRGG
jgi:hypothetical protein